MLISLLLALLPSVLQVPIRRLLGATIGSGARIRFGTILHAAHIDIGEGASIGPFALVRANTLKIGANAQIKPLTICKASKIQLGEYAHIAPTAIVSAGLNEESQFIVGDHSRIFPFCWLEPGEGITIGNQVGVGGHTLIFTHGAWPDYLRGGPVSYGPVVIEDNVWLPWRVFILANVTIGQGAIIGAGSVVNKSVPRNSLAAGLPAKVIATEVIKTPDRHERLRRANEILAEYAKRGHPSAESPRVKFNRLEFSSTIAIDDFDGLRDGDLLIALDKELDEQTRASLFARGVSLLDHDAGAIFVAAKRPYISDFVAFVRRYGIRLYVRSEAH